MFDLRLSSQSFLGLGSSQEQGQHLGLDQSSRGIHSVFMEMRASCCRKAAGKHPSYPRALTLTAFSILASLRVSCRGWHSCNPQHSRSGPCAVPVPTCAGSWCCSPETLAVGGHIACFQSCHPDTLETRRVRELPVPKHQCCGSLLNPCSLVTILPR